MSRLSYREVLALVHEDLTRVPYGQYELLIRRVIELAQDKQLIGSNIAGQELETIRELVREALWECLIKQIVVFGSDSRNAAWPHYRATRRGLIALQAGSPQPYDPDGFIAHFQRVTGTSDAVVFEYVVEAVRAFNANCCRAAAVMLGCASEKLILLLIDSFEASIADPDKRSSFKKKLGERMSISHKYGVLKDRLEKMRTDKDKAKRLPHEHAETVAGELQSGFELLRRCRNAAGHPDVPGDTSSETVFLNLRVFGEYTRRIQLLIQYFASHPVDWS